MAMRVGLRWARMSVSSHTEPPSKAWRTYCCNACQLSIALQKAASSGLPTMMPCWVKNARGLMTVYFDALSKRCNLKTDAIGESFLPLR
jgi:5-keto 4-deoxyuronate isomerase